jgi:hypothetical protein
MLSADVLGMLIARVSGQALGSFMRERIFEPLGMKDTAFHVPTDKIERLSACYVFHHQTQTLELFDDVASSAWRSEPAFESGGGGLVSTVEDYFAFARMMLNKGRYGREQILSRASVELMTSDQLTPQQREGSEIFFGTSRSWGFGMAVDTKRDELFRTPGRFGWDGGFSTSAYTDPVEGVIGILLTQRLMDSPQPPHVFSDFWTLAYGAIGKVLKRRTMKHRNRAAQAFRMAAQAVIRSHGAFGAFYRRMQGRLGPAQALVATAHKIARTVYHMLTYRVPYHDIGATEDNKRFRERELKYVQKKAAKLGYTLSPA